MKHNRSLESQDFILHRDLRKEFPVIDRGEGIYLYDNRVFDIIDKLNPTARGELEITDVNNAYINEGTLTYGILDGWWADCGEERTSLFEASRLVAETGANKKTD